MRARRRVKNALWMGLVVLFGGGALLLGVLLAGYVLWRGFAALSLEMLASEPSLLFGTVGIMPAIVNTLLMMVVCAVAAVPVGMVASNYVSLALPKNRLTKALYFLIDVVAETPTVVYGLVGMLVFCQWAGMQVSVLAGACTMTLALFTEVMAAAQMDVQGMNPLRMRQAVSLGATPGQLFSSIALKESTELLVAGILQAAARVASESIALLLTLGAGYQLADSFATAFEQSGSTLAVMMYIYVQQRADYETGFAIAALLLLLVWLLIFLGNVSIVRLTRRTPQYPREML